MKNMIRIYLFSLLKNILFRINCRPTEKLQAKDKEILKAFCLNLPIFNILPHLVSSFSHIYIVFFWKNILNNLKVDFIMPLYLLTI